MSVNSTTLYSFHQQTGLVSQASTKTFYSISAHSDGNTYWYLTHCVCILDLVWLLAEYELLLPAEHLIDPLPVEHRDLGVVLLDLSDQLLCACNAYMY